MRLRLMLILLALLLPWQPAVIAQKPVPPTAAPEALPRPDVPLPPLNLLWNAPSARNTLQLAWGDVDHDGDLDLALANQNQPVDIFLNTAGQLRLDTSWSPPALNARSLAWGDADGDGDLDLAVGVNNDTSDDTPSVVYRNCALDPKTGPCAGQTDLITETLWSTSLITATTSVAWGDADGDGDLDMAVGITGSPSVVYRNCANDAQTGDCAGQASLSSAILWEAPVRANTESVAWGDADGDGDLDLAVGNLNQKSRVYRNCARDTKTGACAGQASLISATLWEAPENAATRSVAWGDADNDGDLDLAIGNEGTDDQESQVYRNCANDAQTDACAGQASLITAPLWSSGTPATTYGIAWVDLDSDGDLDLSLSNNGQASRVYRNCTTDRDVDPTTCRNSPGILTTETVASTGVGAESSGHAWGDFDGDSDLDLALAAWGAPSQIFSNDLGLFAGDSQAIDISERNIRSLAWGDADGDGDLDLAVGVSGLGSVVLRNCRFDNDTNATTCNPRVRGLTNEVLLTIPDSADTRSLAWGDADGDGDLDLAVGNSGSASTVLKNCAADAKTGDCANQTGLSSTTLWTSTLISNTRSLAWADVDNDGDLDLALGNYEQPSLIYRNCAADDDAGSCADQPSLTNQIFWSAPAAATNQLAWGDVDNDGDLDLAQANEKSLSRLYRNDAGTLIADPRWQVEAVTNAASLAWGDLDGDGKLDLIVGNNGQPSQLYHNTGSALVWDRTWVPQTARTTSVALGDLDNDGDLDLALSNYEVDSNAGRLNHSRIYWNSGGSLGISTWRPRALPTQSLALGDADNDGDLDLIVGNQAPTSPAAPSLIQLENLAANGVQPFGAQATLSAGRPFTDGAPALSAAKIIESRPIGATSVISVSYLLNTTLPALATRARFSLDGGGTWQPATQAGDPSQSLSSGVYAFSWDTFNSGFFGQSDMVQLQVLAYSLPLSGTITTAGSYRYTNRIAGPYLRPFAVGSSVSFRARGTQVRVMNQQEQGVAGALVYRLPNGQSRGGQPLADSSGTPFSTDTQGYLQGRGVLALGDMLIALAQVGDRTAARFNNSAFLAPLNAGSIRDEAEIRFFATSALDQTTGLPLNTRVSRPGLQAITVAPSNPLIVFDLSVSLEWDARGDSGYMTQLKDDLRRTSELLYDWSEGQVALGTIRIYHNKQRWSHADAARGADVRIYATNRLRPNANKGGITRNTIDEQGAQRPTPETLIYEPGQVRIGAVWSRYGGSTGTLGEDWPRSLAHELGHYLLFLDDNYIGLKDGELIQVDTCRGAMSNPYTDGDSEFHPNTYPDGLWADANRCGLTLSHTETGRSDWESIAHFYNQPGFTFTLNQPASYANTGPNNLALNLISFIEVPPPSAEVVSSPLITIRTPEGQPYRIAPGGRPRAFRFTASRVIDLGLPNNDQVVARGAQTGDFVCVYDQPSYLSGCVEVRPGELELALTRNNSWNPDITIVPEDAHHLQVSLPITGTGSLAPGQQLVAWVYPLERDAVISTTLTLSGGSYRGEVDPGESNFQGYVRVVVTGETQRQAMTDYAITGKVPEGTHATEPGLQYHCPTPPPPGCNAPTASAIDGQIILYGVPHTFPDGKYYSLQTATQLPALPRWSIPVGQAYRMVTSYSSAELQDQGVAVNIGYLERELPAGTEGGLAIYHWDGTSWAQLKTTRFDPVRNEIAAKIAGRVAQAGTATDGGIYMLMTSLPMRAGWNIFSYPWSQASQVTSALSDLNVSPRSHYVTLYSYNIENAADPWQVYDVDAPAWVNDLTQLEYGRGYWINVTPRGAATNRPPDDELTAVLPLPPATYYGILRPTPGLSLAPGQPVRALVDGQLCGRASTQLQGGRTVFVVHVASALEGNPLCGLPGRTVTIQIGGFAYWATSWDNSRPHALSQHFLPLLAQ